MTSRLILVMGHPYQAGVWVVSGWWRDGENWRPLWWTVAGITTGAMERLIANMTKSRLDVVVKVRAYDWPIRP